MSEIKTRPDRATGPREVWEREDGAVYVTTNYYAYFHTPPGAIGCSSFLELPEGRYRIRTIDEQPWPELVKVERRRVVEWRNKSDGVMYACYRTLDEPEVKPPNGVVVRDEIRTVEVSPTGDVIRVLPNGGEG